MIKRFRFTDGSLGPRGLAPLGVRPLRVASCSVLPELTAGAPRHERVDIEWFTDATHLGRFSEWEAGQDSGPAPLVVPDKMVADESVADEMIAAEVVADEVVLRGAGWLEQRWREGGRRYKHIALAQRVPGLTAAEFSARWQAHAGTVGGGAVIPDTARGCAYVQNHPRSEGAYDAINEVWFDTIEGLRTRIDWFAANLAPADDLFKQSWLLSVCEHPIR